ncbi:MAG: hypothetical protein LBF41_04370 [Deltaproteobacteria bacterium]|jgi:hypothetical protein|nr:hypothetical protein [Deltaproteobacteria bacterium]
MMISSLLTMANNALLYNGKTLASAPRQDVNAANETSLTEDYVYLSDSVEETEETPSILASTDKFTESLIARLKETGLSGSANLETLAAAAEAANQVVAAVSEKDGALAANQMKALILQNASGEDPEGSIAKAVETYAAAVTLEAATEKAAKEKEEKEEEEEEEAAAALIEEEIAKKTEEKIAREAERKAAATAETAEGEAAVVEEKSADIVAAIRSAVEEIENLSLVKGEASLGIDSVLSIFTKVKAEIGQTADGKFAAATENVDGYGQNVFQSNRAFYGSGHPNPGSLLSLRV